MIDVRITSGEVLLLQEDRVRHVNVTTISMSFNQETVILELETVSSAFTTRMVDIVRHVDEVSMEMQRNSNVSNVSAMVLEPTQL